MSGAELSMSGVDRALESFQRISEREIRYKQQIQSLEAAMERFQSAGRQAEEATVFWTVRRKRPRELPTEIPVDDRQDVFVAQARRVRWRRRKEEGEIHHRYPFVPDFDPGQPKKTERLISGTIRVSYARATRLRFRNGTVVTKTDQFVLTQYPNGDCQQEYPDGASYYRYASNGAIELRLPDGGVIFKFVNGQREHHFVTGEKKVRCSDGRCVTIPATGV
jgi:hypothetical protein